MSLIYNLARDGKIISLTFLFIMYAISHHILGWVEKNDILFFSKWSLFTEQRPYYVDAVIVGNNREEKVMFSRIVKADDIRMYSRIIWYQLQKIESDKLLMHDKIEEKLKKINYRLISTCRIEGRRLPSFILSKEFSEGLCP